MMELSCDPLALTTAVNTLAVSLAARLNDEDLELTAALLVQLGETLGDRSPSSAAGPAAGDSGLLYRACQLSGTGLACGHLTDAADAAVHHAGHGGIGVKGHVLGHDDIAELVEIEPVPIGQNVDPVVGVDDALVPLHGVHTQGADFSRLDPLNQGLDIRQLAGGSS